MNSLPVVDNADLFKKLGYVFSVTSYVDTVAPYYAKVAVDIKLGASEPYDFIHIFVKSQNELHASFVMAKSKLSASGMLWVSWPKKTSGVETDLDFNAVQTCGLELGLVDVKVASVDATWSALKFVYRLKDRK